MENPWKHLPVDGDLVLPQDAEAVRAYNRTAHPSAWFDLSLFPEPYHGDPHAPIVLLALNPGIGRRDHETLRALGYAESARQSLTHELAPLPFLHLQQSADTEGGAWWRRITKPLLEKRQLASVAHSLFCVQYIGYHSKVFASPKLTLASQAYSFSLVRRAMERDAEVVVMRSWRLWVAAIPELLSYRRLHRVRNARNPTLSAVNLPTGFSALLDAMVRST